MQTSELVRRILAGAAMATLVSLPFVNMASAQTDTDTDTDTDSTVSTSTSTTVQRLQTTSSTSPGGTGGLARTGDDWVVPASIAGAGVLLALGSRQIARARSVG